MLNTPFINLQDGRMRPSEVEGAYFEINEIKKTKIEGGWLYGFSPRSTTKWFRGASSIGVYSSGVNTDGTKSQYANNLTSNGVFMLGIHNEAIKNFKLHAWDVFIENILNTAMLQADWQLPLKKESSIFSSAQVIRQDAIKYGGNKNQSKTYVDKEAKAMAFGVRAGWKNKKIETSINYNRITADGRYLMPREWGRDPFFTFLPRERNEGFGDVNAIMAKVNYNFDKVRIKTSLAGGYYNLPDVKNYALNKYGLPSYTQINADVRYSFAGVLKGLEAQILVAGKINDGNIYNNDKYVINKVDMVNYNFVLNYNF
ncbi:MAG TPA: OprD family outer membrane porin [Bacteroidia bacterium]|nr:OprD family outer membrane porin [Bacteroidia bacterium]